MGGRGMIESTCKYDEGFQAGVRFALTHYEQHKTGNPVFTLTDIDPAQWWSAMILTPHPRKLPGSQAHYEARLKRWQELATEYLKECAK